MGPDTQPVRALTTEQIVAIIERLKRKIATLEEMNARQAVVLSARKVRIQDQDRTIQFQARELRLAWKERDEARSALGDREVDVRNLRRALKRLALEASRECDVVFESWFDRWLEGMKGRGK